MYAVSKHKTVWNENTYRKRIEEGRGQGEVRQYLPWVQVQDFSSQGTISRIAGHKTGRTHHFMSSGETDYFYLLDWSDEVLDIREQYPLQDIEAAIAIAADKGIRYPKDPVSGFPYVLTSDFLITTKTGVKARTVKRSAELHNRRTLEKLEIERQYWQHAGIDWKLVTEHEMPAVKIRNIKWLHTAVSTITPPVPKDLIEDIVQYHTNRGHSIYETAVWIERQFNLLEGSGLQIMRQLLWLKIISCDIEHSALWRKPRLWVSEVKPCFQ